MRMCMIPAVLATSVGLAFAGPFVAGSHSDPAADQAMRRACPSFASLSPAGQDAFRELFRADTFAGGKVGYGGETPSEALALRVLLEEQGHATALQDLLEHASPAGRLYALSGLYVADPEAFSKAVAALQPSGIGRALLPRTKVHTLFGCIGGTAYFDDLVKDLQSGTLARDITGRPQQASSGSTP